MFKFHPSLGPIGAFVCLCLSFAGPAAADSHRLQADFTFKRVGVPQPGSGPRITVQVQPTAPPAPSAPAAAGTGGSGSTASAPRAATYAWFWTEVPAELSASGPGRLEQGVLALRRGPGGATVPSPRLDTLRGIAERHGTDILVATIGTEVSPALALAVISVESAGRADATSSAGAQGLMQLMPATAERFGVTDSFNTAANIKGGVAYLDWLLKHFDGDPILALAGYNAGEGAVRQNDGVPPYAETRDYVPKVLAAWTVARGLCRTPPVLASDGCVFAVGGDTNG